MQDTLRGRTKSGDSNCTLASFGSTSVVTSGHFRNEALSQAGFKIGTTVEVLTNLRMREEENLTSNQVCELLPNLHCLVLQHGQGRRLRVRVFHTEKTGWISSKTEGGEHLIEVVESGNPPRASVDVSSTGSHPRVSVIGGTSSSLSLPSTNLMANSVSSTRPSLPTDSPAKAVQDEDALSDGVAAACCLFAKRKENRMTEKEEEDRGTAGCCRFSPSSSPRRGGYRECK